MLKCSKCNSKNELNLNIDACAVDVIGFVVICLILVLPFWGITELYLLVEAVLNPLILLVSSFISYRKKFYILATFFAIVLVALPFGLLSKLWDFFVPIYPLDIEVYLPILGFLVAYYRVSRVPYKYLSMLVNYKFEAQLLCPSCHNISYELKLPGDESDVSNS